MEKLKLKDVAEARTGFQVRARLTPSDAGTHFIVLMRNISAKTGGFNKDAAFCRVSPGRNVERHLLKAGDVLVLTRGNNHSATLITEEHRGYVAAGQFVVLRLKTDECLPEYLCWYLNSAPSQAHLAREARGTGVKIVDKKTLENMTISLPDVAIQKKIAALDVLAKREEELLGALSEKRRRLIYSYCDKAIAADIYGRFS